MTLDVLFCFAIFDYLDGVPAAGRFRQTKPNYNIDYYYYYYYYYYYN